MTTNDTDRRIMCAIHGWWGSGKTWFAHTSPGPRLVMDMEGGSEDVLVPMVYWNPVTTPVSSLTGLTEDTSVVVDIQDYDIVNRLLDILETGDHPFESVVFDSLTETQKQLKQKVSQRDSEGNFVAYDPNATFDMQAWGRLLNNGELVIRRLRDLTRKHSAKRVNVVVVMGSDTESVPIRPLLQGALRKSLAGFFDLEGFLRTGVNAEGEEGRILQISPSAEAEAKCRLHLLKVEHGTHIINPDMREMLAVINRKESK